MRTLKINRLRAGIAFMVLLVGFFVVVSAMERKGEANVKQDELHWFQISGSYNDDVAVSPSDAAYINSNLTPPEGTGCNGTQRQCVSGFTTDQTVVVGGIRMLNGSQTPAEVAYYKN